MKYFCDTQRHLVCVPYSEENLHKMAEDLKIHRCFFEKSRVFKFAHYDIPKRRVQEISSKCTIVSFREILRIIKNS